MPYLHTIINGKSQQLLEKNSSSAKICLLRNSLKIYFCKFNPNPMYHDYSHKYILKSFL